jgi:nitroreductase
MSSVNVTEALSHGSSARVFLNRPVAAPMVLEILELASRSPSGGNLQPYKVYAVSGEVKERLCKLVAERSGAGEKTEQADIHSFPSELAEPWRSRRENSDTAVCEAMNISRRDQIFDLDHSGAIFSFFGAPVGLIITMDRSLSESQIMDTGIYLQSVLLLACERGLATCPMASWAQWPDTVREVLGIDKREMVMAGVSLGYAKADEPVNGISHPCLRAEQFISMHGF